MGYIVSQLQAVLTLEDRGFTSGMKRAQQETRKTAESADDAGKRFEKVSASLTRLGATLSVGVTAPLVLLGRRMVQGAAQTDSMRRSLEAVEGSAARAERQFKRLEQVAKIPGLGFPEAVKGYVNLRAAGMQAELSERALRGFGNALAVVGSGKEELEGVVLALTQIQAKGKVSAEEINQLAERLPQIRQLMKDAFGTSDTEIIQRAGISSEVFIEQMVSATEKLKKASSGIKNELDNATESIDRSLARLGSTLAPKAASGLNYIADKIEKLAAAWDKLPKEKQDLATNLGIAALGLGPGLVAIGAVAQLAINLKELGLSLSIIKTFGVGALPILATLAAFKPHWDASKETVQLEKQAREGDKYVESTKLGQTIRLKTETRTMQDYLGYLKKGQGAYEFFRANRGPQSGEIMSLMDRELGTNRLNDSPANVSQAIARLQAQTQKIIKDHDAQRAAGMNKIVSQIFKDMMNPSSGKRGPALDIVALAAKKQAEKDAAKEAERLRKEQEREARQHRENFARNTQEGKDELALLTAPNEFARQRREAEQKRRDNLKGMDKKVAEEIYQAELKKIAKLEQDAKDKAWEDGFGEIAKRLKADISTLEKQREFERRTLEKWGMNVDKSMTSGTREQSSSILSTIQSQIRRQRAEDKQLKALEGGMGGWSDGLMSSIYSTVRTQQGARQKLQEHHARVNGRQVTGDISRGVGDFAYDLLQGRGAGQAAKRVSQTLITALNQGAAKEIERVVARSLTDPIAKAIERGFDPIASKLSRSIEASTKGLRMSAEDILASAYGLYAIANRKKKFGIGTVLGGVGGFFLGGPGGAIAGANFGNALDNGDMAGAVTSGLVYAGGQFAKSGGGSSGNAPADGRSVVVNNNFSNSGWVVNHQADENRLLTNMARRVRVASVVGG